MWWHGAGMKLKSSAINCVSLVWIMFLAVFVKYDPILHFISRFLVCEY